MPEEQNENLEQQRNWRNELNRPKIEVGNKNVEDVNNEQDEHVDNELNDEDLSGEDEQTQQQGYQRQLIGQIARDRVEKLKQAAKEKLKQEVKKKVWQAVIKNPYFWIVVAVILGIIVLILIISYFVGMVHNNACGFLGGIFSWVVGVKCN